MQLDWRIRLALVVVGGAIAIAAIAGASWGGLDEDAVTAALAVVGSLLAGLGIAGGPSASAGASTVLLLVALAGSACAPCVAEQAVVSALDVGLSAADEAVGDASTEEYRDAMSYANGAVLLGRAAVEACELARDGAGWQAWVGLALEAAMGVASHFGGAADGDIPSEPPDGLTSAIAMLRSE